MNKIVGVKNIQPKTVRNLNRFLTARLDRIATMMEILLAAHDNWTITGKRDVIVMETDTFDFKEAIKVLKEHGFTSDEFILRVEYTRKWGFL
ncbi:hypothetical protein [Calderihabitans maritimus]|uniref:hypothetical protein n=1 Tax=Calderihabitans maritimus TaxID=1246530 RepID=UPI001EE0B903|nr:hypothetical protein [Calderihabitans maritimus]